MPVGFPNGRRSSFLNPQIMNTHHAPWCDGFCEMYQDNQVLDMGTF